jgi:hypothetical protein
MNNFPASGPANVRAYGVSIMKPAAAKNRLCAASTTLRTCRASPLQTGGRHSRPGKQEVYKSLCALTIEGTPTKGRAHVN